MCNVLPIRDQARRLKGRSFNEELYELSEMDDINYGV